MPQVRRQREISLTPLPGVRKTAAETALSRGAGLAQAQAVRAEAIGNVGEVVARIGVAKYTQIKNEERETANQAIALEMSNRFAKFDADYFNDPAMKQGKDAMGVPADWEEKFTKTSGEIEMLARTPEQQQAYQQIKARYYQNGYTTSRRYSAAEMKGFIKQELSSKLKNGANAAVVHALDPARRALEISEGEFALREMGPKLGLGPQQIEEQVGVFKSDAMGGVITNLISKGFDVEARVYFEEHQDEITNDAVRAQMGEKVKRATTAAEGERTAEEIYGKSGPKSDLDDINLDDMERQVREKYGPEQKDYRDAAINALRSRVDGVNAGRRSRQNGKDNAIWGGIARGQTEAQIKATAAYINSDGETQEKVVTFFRNEAARAESLAASRISRAASAESVAYSRAQREQQKLEDDHWAEFWALNNDKDALRKMDEAEIFKKLPELGRDHVNRLIARKNDISKSDAAYRSAVIDTDTFKAVAEQAGMTWITKPRSTWTKPQSSLAGRLQDEVEAEIGRRQVKEGVYLQREEKTEIAHSIIDAQALKPGGWFPWSSETVRFTDISADDRERITNSLNKLNAELAAKGQPTVKVTPQRILDAYMLKPVK